MIDVPIVDQDDTRDVEMSALFTVLSAKSKKLYLIAAAIIWASYSKLNFNGVWMSWKFTSIAATASDDSPREYNSFF